MWNDGLTVSHHYKALGGRGLVSSVITADLPSFPLSKLLFLIRRAQIRDECYWKGVPVSFLIKQSSCGYAQDNTLSK